MYQLKISCFFILKQYLFGQLSIETYVGLKWVMGQQKLSETKIISYNNGSHIGRQLSFVAS